MPIRGGWIIDRPSATMARIRLRSFFTMQTCYRISSRQPLLSG